MSREPEAQYSGEIHYWRHPAEDWAQLLGDLRNAGFDGVTSCVPWSVHERHKGSFDFSGPRDLAQFIALAGECGLAVHLRLGPMVGAELTGFGVPERVLANVACQAKTGRGTPLWLPWPTKMFAAPSHASEVFQEEVREWFAALGAVVERASVSVACDWRQTGRTAAFDADYHPDAIAWWLEYSEGQSAPTAHTAEDVPRILRWVRFREVYRERSLEWLERAAEDAGMRLGSCPKLLRIGGAPWFPVEGEDAQKISVLQDLAMGTKRFSLSMAVARERWSGAALECDWVAPLLATLQEAKAHTLQAKAPIAVITHEAETAAAVATCALPGASPAVLEWMQLGPSGASELSLDASARAYPRWVAAVTRALDMLEVPHVVLDASELHKINSETRAVVAPTLRRIDGSVWGALYALCMAGMPVVLGPEVPMEDEFGEALGDGGQRPSGSGLLAAESLDDLDGLADSLLALAGDLGDLWIAPEADGVTCTPLFDEAGVAQLCFVHNRGDAGARARVNVPVGSMLRDGIGGQEILEADGQAEVSLTAGEVRIFRVEASA